MDTPITHHIAIGDHTHEVTIEFFNGDLYQLYTTVIQCASHIKNRHVGGVITVVVNTNFRQRVFEGEKHAKYANRAGNGGRGCPDLIGASRNPIATGRSHTAH